MGRSLISSSSIAPDSLITIVPDGSTKTFSVSKAILCDTSEFFVKALNGDFKEAHKSTLRFPGFGVETVEWFLFWAHKRHLPDFETQILGSDKGDENSARDAAQTTLISIWVFADAHLVPKLQNEAMSQLVYLTADWHTPALVVRHGYNIAPKGSALSEFVMDEARYMYFSTPASFGFGDHDLENLALLPGFMIDFLGPVRSHLMDAGKVHSESYQCAHEIGSENYMVEEN